LIHSGGVTAADLMRYDMGLEFDDGGRVREEGDGARVELSCAKKQGGSKATGTTSLLSLDGRPRNDGAKGAGWLGEKGMTPERSVSAKRGEKWLRKTKHEPRDERTARVGPKMRSV